MLLIQVVCLKTNFRNLNLWTPFSGPSCHKNDWAPSYGEDCLYLNIFVPKKAVEENRKVPVGFWIHGGGFESGAGSVLIYDGRFWAHESDMVLGLSSTFTVSSAAYILKLTFSDDKLPSRSFRFP